MDDTALAIGRINTLPPAELAAEFRRCVAVPRWADELVAARPFDDENALFAAADRLTGGLTDAEVLAALADHPRIGERTGSALSASEQSGVDRGDADLAARLLAGNAAYEERFGHLYLVCASGRGGRELLADLEARLANDPATELGVVRRELAGIARVRLAGLVA